MSAIAAVCRLIGHRPAFRGISLPKQWFCARCGKRLS